MYRPLKLRVRLARRFARQKFALSNDVEIANLQQVAARIDSLLGSSVVIARDKQIIVTEAGFVTMALYTAAASQQQDLLAVPGVDDHGQVGYLVLREGHVPYHSLAYSAMEAAVETRKAHAKAADLVTYYGSRSALKEAALSAPWYLVSRTEDVSSAGLCEWGANSFLHRYGLFRVAYGVGLPRIALRMAGNYGNRVTAATLRRRLQELNACSRVTSNR